MQRLCRITVPGLSLNSDFEGARRRLLEEFPNIHDVVATTLPATVLVLYSGAGEGDAWYDALLDSITVPELRAKHSFLGMRARRLRGGDVAA